MKRLIPILTIGFLLSAGLLFWRYQNIAREASGLAPGTLDSAEPLPATPILPPASSSGALTPSPTGVAPSFISYLQTEAEKLNAPKVNAELAEQEIAAQAASMGENEIRYARDLALGPQNPANQRILSAFLLGAAGAKGRQACRDLILMTTNSARAQPHSVDELKNTQAKSISGMCVDALAEQALRDPSAREELQRIASEVKDETLKKLVQQKLRELPSL